MFAHCGSCGVGPAREKDYDWGKKKLDSRINMIRAFDMSESDRKKMIVLEKTFHKDMQTLRARYKVKASTLLNDVQKEVYFMKKRGRDNCCKVKGQIGNG